MVDFTYNEGKTSDAPLAKVYIFARCVSLSDLLSLQLHGLLVGWIAYQSCCLYGHQHWPLKNSFALLVTYAVVAGVYQGWCWREGLWPIECRIHC